MTEAINSDAEIPSHNGASPEPDADDRGSSFNQKTAFLIVGVVAAVVSAATVGYFFWRRSQLLSPKVESVQRLLDRCHDQIQDLHTKLDNLSRR